MTYNAAERKDVRRAEKDDDFLQRQRKDVVQALMSTSPGRAYIWAELGQCHIFASSFSLDPLQMAFTEGERNIGLRNLNDILEWCPDQFVQMMREQNARQHAADANRTGDADPGDDDGSD